MTRRSTPLPSGLARMPLRVFRPQDVAHVYAFPRPELARLADAGILHRVARGYYAVVPPEYAGSTWRPGLEAAAAGVAGAIYGASNAVVMGVSAARLHGVLPRALATAVVAVPHQHRPIDLVDRDAVIRFVQRDTEQLDAELVSTQIGEVLVTTPEQTVLDLAKRTNLGDAAVDVPQAIASLYRRSDPARLDDLARAQRLRSALERARSAIEVYA
ncbi:type IV toxin-antitoxin system AbiEi family antitoxin [Gordonia sp. (in: high G+C Gram-positive bacteria)]|uniref:type IV toxin-antitoxin system AbiEi family antitoxin domain-containing protein n=1 Tax=Gordonia sp. (in: high G+C Gram-positive bacteria) TaxID=84139 RepID=UPI0026046601|nr:type IV toxin-antitoxin system AbiEi family antitoxin [Gordonia sp. (in: high G+C Gram-positive bacteria)]HMS76688.1 type IV toxin-antitoxin system AbiEi family antitoxin [Gordonia sp. (in: high G+C Gram-positive bacteria)]